MVGLADDSSPGGGLSICRFGRGVMSKKRRRSKTQPPEPVKTGRKMLLNYLLAFAFGAVITGGVAMLIAQGGKPDTNQPDGAKLPPAIAGHRSVADLMALSDAELEQVDVVEMSTAVAKEIPGCENLDYQHYKQIVDGWTNDVRQWMSVAEVNFEKSPQEWRNDLNFFRLGLLATYLTRERGVRYHEKYSQDQKAGKNSKYEEPGAVLVHGLIDTLRGTCATMPVLHVASSFERPGGAANVAANIRSLGAVPRLVGIVGTDEAGQQLSAVLTDCDVATEWLQCSAATRTTTKTRLLSGHQQIARLQAVRHLVMVF